MARHKEFDRDAVLERAIAVFARHGFEGTSTDALLDAMHISRQSLYDTFGDKRKLYLAALQRYNTESTAQIIGTMHEAESPVAGLENALIAFAMRPPEDAGIGCLGVSAICEFGTADPDVNAISQAAGRSLSVAIRRQVERAITAGEADKDVDPAAAAGFIAASLAGMKVAARGGADGAALRGIAGMIIRSLR